RNRGATAPCLSQLSTRERTTYLIGTKLQLRPAGFTQTSAPSSTTTLLRVRRPLEQPIPEDLLEPESRVHPVSHRRRPEHNGGAADRTRLEHAVPRDRGAQPATPHIGDRAHEVNARDAGLH